jgi:hypothetical protein
MERAFFLAQMQQHEAALRDYVHASRVIVR